MTVDDYDMRIRGPAAASTVGRDGGAIKQNRGKRERRARGLPEEERWMALADLRDGKRETWMTDRAKHALGTAK